MGEGKRKDAISGRQARTAAATVKREENAKIQAEREAMQAKFEVEVADVSKRYGLELAAMKIQPARFVVTDLDSLIRSLEKCPQRPAMVPSCTAPLGTGGDPPVYSGPGDQGRPAFVDAPAGVPAASAVPAMPDLASGGFHDPATDCACPEKTECDDCNTCGAVLANPPADLSGCFQDSGFDPTTDTDPRESGCVCHLETGDSPCPVHGEDEEVSRG